MAFGEGRGGSNAISARNDGLTFVVCWVTSSSPRDPMPRRIAIPGKRQQKLNDVLSNLTRGSPILLVDYESC
jgi:hypothetical protein